MIPIWGTAAVLMAPPAALFLNGYSPGNSLPSQYWNYVWHSITSEIDNVLSAASITPNGAVNNQLITAIQALIAVVASATQFGVVKVDNTTIKATAGVLVLIANAGAYAPLPQTLAGVGQDYNINSTAVNTALYLTTTGGVGGAALPGTWEYICWYAQPTTGLMGDSLLLNGTVPVGIAAGGTQIMPAYVALWGRAKIWRIA